MSKSFTKPVTLDSQFTDGICDQVEVDVSIYADDEDDPYYQIDYIYNVTQSKELKLDDLSREEQKLIEAIGDELAYEHGYEVYQDDLIGKADALYDSMKEGD